MHKDYGDGGGAGWGMCYRAIETEHKDYGDGDGNGVGHVLDETSTQTIGILEYLTIKNCLFLQLRSPTKHSCRRSLTEVHSWLPWDACNAIAIASNS